MNHALTRPTGALALLAGVLVILYGLVAGAVPALPEMSDLVATGIVVLTIAVVSLFCPRWDEGRSLLAEHPAGVTGAAVTVLTWAAPLVGIDLTAEQAVTLISGVTLLVSYFTPIAVPATGHTVQGEPGQTVEKHPNVEWPDGSKGARYLTIPDADAPGAAWSVPVVPADSIDVEPGSDDTAGA